MRMDDCRRLVTVAIIAWISCADQAIALDIVGGGKPLVTVVVEGDDVTDVQPPRTGGVRPAVGQRKRGDRAFATDADAANVLIEWVRKMTGATLAISGSAPKEGNAIYIGESAVKAGLRLDQIDSPSREGIRVVADKTRVLVAGQSPQATARAVCRLLEIMGCRYFMDGPLGEVYTKTANLRVASMDVTEKPALLHRRIWGSRWTAPSLWKVWNGAGGIEASGDHAWGRYIPKSLFQTHPEYFAMRNDERRSGDWYCTSNMQLREEFARGVIAAIKNGETSPSISPPDGRGYCECAACKAQDNAQSLEPTTGTVSVTDRYVDFFNDVASRVAKAYPQTMLNFYAYADYTQPPKRGTRLAPNLCVWLAPIRYCRLHAIGDPHCPSRVQLAETIDGWAEASDRIGYRTYNYNLAECLVPFSLISVWSHDIPLLKSKGCFGINNETLPSWQIYGPHIYLSARLAYDPAADASAITEDYFTKFYGPAAGAMKAYWSQVDEAFAKSNCHSGGFHGIEPVYSAELVDRCERLLASAFSAAQGDANIAKRIAMCREGLMNARQYRSIVDAMNVGKFVEAQKIATALIARTESQTRRAGAAVSRRDPPVDLDGAGARRRVRHHLSLSSAALRHRAVPRRAG